MSTNKKYDYQIEQRNSIWTAQITRKVTSKKTVISKEKTDFTSDADATKWAIKTIAEFTKTQNLNNQRHGSARQLNKKVREDRSTRRADKTARAKAAKTQEPATDKPDN